jgi:DNA-binding IclR family transcriptional regulator
MRIADHQPPEMQILAAIHRKPASIDDITRRVRFTRHPSRVRLALFQLRELGLVEWDPEGRWRATPHGAVAEAREPNALEPVVTC